jgi:ribonuclease HI
MTYVILNFDGGARPTNPGPAAIGYVLISPEQKWKRSKAIGRATNNVAEYQALINGLRFAIDQGYRSIEIRGDSELIIKQVQGEYGVKDQKLQELHGLVQQLMNRFDEFRLQHVPREQNREADELVDREFEE